MRLLIVDDEPRTREMLRKHVQWDALGVAEVQTAGNGLEALRLAGDWKPDVVLCDVRMPKMDGIEFAKRLRWTDTSCKVIFLSGFSDKEYLLSAIHLKAMSYIEKPINLEQVKNTVQEAVLAKQEELRLLEEERKLQHGYKRSLPFLKQDLVRRLIDRSTAADTGHMLSMQHSLPFSPGGPFTVVVAPMYRSPSDLVEEPLFGWEDVLTQLNDLPALSALGALCGFDAMNRLVLILPGAYGISYRDNRLAVEHIYDGLRQAIDPKLVFAFGIGKPVQRLEDLPDSYRIAGEAGSLLFYHEDNRMLFPEERGGSGSFEPNPAWLKQFREALARGELAPAEQILRKLTGQAAKDRDLTISRVRDVYFQYLSAIMETAERQNLADRMADAETEIRHLWLMVNTQQRLHALEAYVLSFLEIFRMDEWGNSGKLLEIIRYIHAHFHERGFNIQDIADHVNLSYTYLSSYFKKQKGQTVKEYISEVKADKAKELLGRHELKLYDVALQLGFADANYFTTFFKKITGLTPSEYRELIGR